MNLEPYLSATPSSCITPRIVWSLLTEILVLILTIILAMIDTSDFTQAFFYIRLGLILAIILAMIDTSDFPQVWAKSLWNSRYILIYTYIYIIYIQCGNIYIYIYAVWSYFYCIYDCAVLGLWLCWTWLVVSTRTEVNCHLIYIYIYIYDCAVLCLWLCVNNRSKLSSYLYLYIYIYIYMIVQCCVSGCAEHGWESIRTEV